MLQARHACEPVIPCPQLSDHVYVSTMLERSLDSGLRKLWNLALAGQQLRDTSD